MKIWSPDASFPKGKAEGSRRRIERTRSFVLVPFTRLLGIEERSAKKYHTKCQIEKDVVHAAAKRALEAKAKNGGQMPDMWYTKYVAEMRQTPAGCHMVITAEDIRNKVRALEKAAAADSISVSSVTCRVAQVPPSGGSSILTEDRQFISFRFYKKLSYLSKIPLL